MRQQRFPRMPMTATPTPRYRSMTLLSWLNSSSLMFHASGSAVVPYCGAVVVVMLVKSAGDDVTLDDVMLMTDDNVTLDARLVLLVKFPRN